MKNWFKCIFIGLMCPLMALSNDTLKLEAIPSNDTLPWNFDKNLNGLCNLCYLDQSEEIIVMDSAAKQEAISAFNNIPDSLLEQRIKDIPSVVNLSYNKIVRRYIQNYVVGKGPKIETLLGMANYYFPIFDDIFDYYEVPNEMKYMSIIESALNPRARSRAGAVGLWQFMYSTGRFVGLEVNSLVDERKDPVASSHAAAKYVKHLYEKYHDWILVIAAYNCGPGNVNKAIRRAGGKSNYWDIYYFLPRETRGHIPAFIAATYLMHYYKEHKLYPQEIHLSWMHDTVMVKDKLHLKQLAHVLDIPLQELRDMNPHYSADIIPGKKERAYSLRLPQDNALEYITLKDSIIAYKADEYFDPKKASAKPKSYKYTAGSPGANYEKLLYTVKSGDNLGYIAEWYDVGLSYVRRWNGIYRNNIRVGQKIVIYKPKSKASAYYDINKLSFSQKQKREGKGSIASASSAVYKAPSGEYVVYTVKNGDSLWEIARKFPGVSDSDIKRWNDLSSSSIKPGQRIRIYKKS